MHVRVPFFRIFYSTTYTVLILILCALLIISPGDAIYQAYANGRQFFDIFTIAGVYLLTAVLIVLVYASRLYANRTYLASIPKSSIPIEKADVGTRVRRLIVDGLAKSAVIAYETHPRDLKDDEEAINVLPTVSALNHNSNHPEAHRNGVSSKVPPWGTISHPGWSSPSSLDLPNLQYTPVILELPHLIEAKAVSLAPPDPLSIPPPSPQTTEEPPETPLPSALAVDLLQRPATMGLRDYFSHLSSLGVIGSPAPSTQFLALYERARFSDCALPERDFRTLMSLFADILRGMTELDPALVASLRAAEEDDDTNSLSSSSGSKSLDSSGTVEHNTPFHTPLLLQGDPVFDNAFARPSPRSATSRSGSEGTVHTSRSRLGAGRRASSSRALRSERKRSRRSTPRRVPSANSLQRVQTAASSTGSQRSGGSVIRLAEAKTPLDLPYTITTPEGKKL
ncbi:hypothetical protein MMC20_006219 [Loxospora ochrophaea]|nr:hypothetical protein [Loxospora ochrophaea]